MKYYIGKCDYVEAARDYAWRQVLSQRQGLVISHVTPISNTSHVTGHRVPRLYCPLFPV